MAENDLPDTPPLAEVQLQEDGPHLPRVALWEQIIRWTNRLGVYLQPYYSLLAVPQSTDLSLDVTSVPTS